MSFRSSRRSSRRITHHDEAAFTAWSHAFGNAGTWHTEWRAWRDDEDEEIFLIGGQFTQADSAEEALAATLPERLVTPFTLDEPAILRFGFGDDALHDNRGGISLQITYVPEPASGVMALLGMGAVVMRRRRERGQRPAAATFSGRGRLMAVRLRREGTMKHSKQFSLTTVRLTHLHRVRRGVAMTFAAGLLTIAGGGGAWADDGGASFEGLGLPRVNAVSADGSVVVGQSFGEAIRWENGVLVGLGFLPGGTSSTATSVNADGSVIVGTANNPDVSQIVFRWENGSMISLGTLPGRERSQDPDVSADGSVVVGEAIGVGSTPAEAFRWVNGTMTGLGHLPEGEFSQARAVSADGSVVVGRSFNRAFRWEDGSMVGLHDIPTDGSVWRAFDVNADGSVVVGQVAGGDDWGAFRWEDGVMTILGEQPDGDFLSATAVSADGSILVGSGLFDSSSHAVIWDAASGMRRVHDVLVDDFNLDLSGWTLRDATGISADGNVIVGGGLNPDGRSEGWIARLAAQLFRWTNTDGGLFSEGDNWETPNPPGENDTAIIDEAGTYTITLDDSVTNAGLDVSGGGVNATLDLAGFGYNVGELAIGDGGALTFTGGVAEASESVVVADGALTIEGAATEFAAPAGAIVGQDGEGVLSVRDGAVAEISEHLKLGIELGSNGNVLIEDEGSELELKGDLTVADAGSGNVSVLNGGTFATKELEDDDEQVIAEGKTKVGVQVGSTGGIMVDGEDSAFTSKGSLTLGDEGNGTIEVSDGGAFTARHGAKFGVELGATGDASVVDEDSTLTVQGTLTLGDAGAGRLLVGDGASASADAVKMGRQLNATGELIVSGQMSVFEVDGALIAGGAGHADVLVEAGGRLDTASLTIGAEAFVRDRLVTVDGGDSLLRTGETLVGDQGNGSLVIRNGGRAESGVAPATPAGATLGHGAFGDGSVLISGGGSEWEVGGELTVSDGGFGIIDVELGGQLTSAGGQLGATGNGGQGHVTINNPDSRWTSTEAIILAGTDFGDTDPGPGTGQAILNVLDHATVEAPLLTLGAGLAPGYLNVQSGGKIIADDGVQLRWGNMDVAGSGSEVRSSDGGLAVGNATAAFADSAFGSFDTVSVHAPIDGGSISELSIAHSTVEATNTLDPAVVVGGEAGGIISMVEGLLDAQGGDVFVDHNGIIAGTGTVRGNVSGSGLISPGLSPGILTINGNYAQEPSGSLLLEIGGLTPGIEHDVLEITGDGTFDGEIVLAFIDRFSPQMGDSFDLIDVGGTLNLSSASFLTTNLLPGFEFDITATDSGMQMTALTDGHFVPEPGTASLLGACLLVMLRRRQPIILSRGGRLV